MRHDKTKLHENNAYQMLKYLPPGGSTSGLINNETRWNENNDYEMLKYFALDGGCVRINKQRDTTKQNYSRTMITKWWNILPAGGGV